MGLTVRSWSTSEGGRLIIFSVFMEKIIQDGLGEVQQKFITHCLRKLIGNFDGALHSDLTPIDHS